MARINVEDKFWNDSRFRALVGCFSNDEEKAAGRMLKAWRIAQEWWTKDRQLIPDKIWRMNGLGEELIECDLARRTDDGIYVSGARAQFDWIMTKRQAGRKGGQASVKARLKSEIKTDTSKQKPSREQAPLEKIEASLLFTPSLSPSLSQKKNTIAQSADADRALNFDFEILYKKYPRKIGKTKGLKTCKTQIKTQEDYEKLSAAIDRYAKYCREKIKEVQFIKHFSTFMSSWRDWIDFEKETQSTGAAPDRRAEVLEHAKRMEEEIGSGF